MTVPIKVDMQALRSAIQDEYAEVATQPEKAIDPAQSALDIYARIGTTKGEPLAAAY